LDRILNPHAPVPQTCNLCLITPGTDDDTTEVGVEADKIIEIAFTDPELPLDLPDVACRNVSPSSYLSVRLGLRAFDFDHPAVAHEAIR
jgi:hypothetical protein